MQENRFTYSPAYQSSQPPLSFESFLNKNTANFPQSNYVPSPPLYTSNLPATFNRPLTFGQPLQSSTQPVRITFNQNSSTSTFLPPPSVPILSKPPITSEQVRPFVPNTIVNDFSGKLKTNASSKNVQANGFVVDTSDIKFAKEDEFTGCCHCFSPITFSTKTKKPLCG